MMMSLLMSKLKRNTNKPDVPDVAVTVIEPMSGWQILNIKELREYRDLFYFLVWRNIKVLYAQTVLGFAWAIINPFVQIVIFSIIFGRLAKMPSEGFPYILFSSVGIIPWTYMSRAMSVSSQSLVAGKAMLGKIYFPRLIYPIVPVLTSLIDFSISTIILLCLFIYYGIMPTWNLVLFPFFLLLMACVPTAIGLWLSSLAIRFRDVNFAMSFVIRMLMYSAPIVYSASTIPEKYRIIYSLNPIVAVIEGMRASLLGTPLLWQYIAPGVMTLTILLLSGAFYFKRMERVIVDVI
jgi:lipopolysaccharide transport system permease protein